MGLSNTASMALLGTIGGPWGAAIGAGVGLAMDFAAANNGLEDAIKAADAALESMDAQSLTTALSSINSELDKFGDWEQVDGLGDFLGDTFSVERSVAMYDELGDKLGLWQSAASKAKDRQGELEEATKRANLALIEHDRQLAFVAAAEKRRDETQKLAQDFFNLGEAFENPALGLDRLMSRIQKQTQATLDWTTNAQKALDLGLDPTALQQLRDELGPEAGLALEQLVKGGKRAIDAYNGVYGAALRAEDQQGRFFDQLARDVEPAGVREAVRAYKSLPKDVRTEIKAEGIPKTQAEVDRLVAKYKLTEKDREALIRLSAGQAFTTIQQLVSALNAINGKTAVTYVETRHIRVGSPFGKSANPTHNAGGGLIRGPGGPTDDLIPAYLSNREYVVKAAAVQKYGVDFFDRLNAMQFADGGIVLDPLSGRVRKALATHGTVPGYAGGGRVSGQTVAPRLLRADAATVRHVVEVHVVGEMDLRHARAQLVQMAEDVSRDQIDQHTTWSRTQGH
jgi:hypothetical protein